MTFHITKKQVHNNLKIDTGTVAHDTTHRNEREQFNFSAKIAYRLLLRRPQSSVS